ncbi:glycosyltransferase [Flavisolibacter sp. BT320]|nr:glycosyltransferase [Flavisolibacter longurius]
MSNQPLVSIAVCTYNGAAFLLQQLQTIVMQTYQNLEIVIVDDASTDDTAAIVSQVAAQDRRVRFFQNEKNLGFNKNFEKAVTLCRGEYIAISDQDDVWEQNKIEVMMKQWPADCDFVYSLSEDFSGESPTARHKKIRTRLYSGSEPQKLYFESPIHGHASMFKTSLLAHALPFPATVFYDWWLSVIASSVGKVGCIPELLTHHRVHPNNSSRDLVRIEKKEVRNEQLRQQRKQFIEAFLEKPFVKADVRSFSNHYLSLLQKKQDDEFSFPFFLFFFKNRNITFYYKKNRSVLSLLKNSYKRARTGL